MIRSESWTALAKVGSIHSFCLYLYCNNMVRRISYNIMVYYMHETSNKCRKIKQLLEFSNVKNLCILTLCFTGEFGIVYKAHLIQWHGQGGPKVVTVKTLKGKILLHNKKYILTSLHAGHMNTDLTSVYKQIGNYKIKLHGEWKHFGVRQIWRSLTSHIVFTLKW